ncbi:hypothetical protein DL95DRAFT_385027 [Leptodontidium sp. 2 PMI_412]|nr:hypothetical protein DL95DRAFT_385027 [Leptodontidium sp. 2 PMI_412]
MNFIPSSFFCQKRSRSTSHLYLTPHLITHQQEFKSHRIFILHSLLPICLVCSLPPKPNQTNPQAEWKKEERGARNHKQAGEVMCELRFEKRERER